MEYNKIISVTGLGGLYELVGSKTDGAIVRSLDDKTVRFISSRQHNFSHLESVEVFTTGHNVNLVEVFLEMGKSQEALPSDKDQKAVKAYFEKVYPELDFDRVYASDMKKIVKWFAILKNNDIEIKAAEPEAEEETAEPVAETTPVVAEAAPAEEAPAKPAKKKAAPKKEAADTAEEAAPEAPKKKASKKKSEE